MRYYLTFLLFGLPQLLAAQTLHISEPYQTRTHLGYEILGKVGESYLLFRDKGSDFDVMAFNGGMVNTWTRDIDIPSRNTKILSVLSTGNDFSVFYKTRLKGGDFVLAVRKFDPNAQLIDTLTIKNYGNSYSEQPVLETVLSEDKQTIAFINSVKEDRLEILCFQIDKMRLLWEKAWFMDESGSDRIIPGFVLTNTGTLYLVLDENNKRSKMSEHQMRIVAMFSGSDELHLLKMPELLTSDLAWQMDHEHKKLICAGLYSDKSPEKVLGHFVLRFDVESKTHTIEYTPFDDQMASVIAGKDVTDVSKGIPHLQVRKLYLRRDGGTALVCERNHFIERGLSSTRSNFWNSVPRRVVDYFFDDMVILATYPDGKMHWRTILHKKQYSQDDEGIYSSFFVLLGERKMRLIFNDQILNENTCSSYVLEPDGSYKRESILNTENRKLRLRFRDALQTNAKEILVPSEYGGKMQLVRLEF